MAKGERRKKQAEDLNPNWEYAWFAETSKASWRNAGELKKNYATASVVSNERIVFNIKGNDYRLVVAIDFEKSIVWIKWIGTHKQYDRINVKDIKYHG